MRALPRLYEASLDSATFADYGGHLLLALALIATTSSHVRVRQTARSVALERAHHWRARWSEFRAGLKSDTVMQMVIAIYAGERLGLEHDSIRADLQRAVEIGRSQPHDVFSWTASYQTEHRVTKRVTVTPTSIHSGPR